MPHNIYVAPGNGGGDQVQIGPSPFTSVMGQASVGLANGEHNQKYFINTITMYVYVKFIVKYYGIVINNVKCMHETYNKNLVYVFTCV